VVDVRGPLLVMPGVLDPVATKVGAWFAEDCVAASRPGERWLDMGCGTGVVGVRLAEAGAIVTAVDLDPRAVENVRANAVLRGVAIDARAGDLFAPVAAERFDVVAFNPPFWPGRGEGKPFAAAMYAGEDFAILRRFLREVRGVSARARIVISERGGDFAAARAAIGSLARLERRTWVGGEWLDVFVV
jgi:methylase of polypeptide subunit release factors